MRIFLLSLSWIRSLILRYIPGANRLFNNDSSQPLPNHPDPPTVTTAMPTSTIDIIPHEILSHIFSMIARDPTINPMLLSRITHVCAQWRSIALSTGSLWRRIVLTFPISNQHHSYIIAWLSRSGGQPLDILLDLRDPNWDWDEESHSIRWQEMEAIVHLLLPHVNRWRSFDLLTDTWAPIFTFLWYARKVEAPAVPLLEKLSLSRCNAYFAARGQTFQPSSLAQPMVLLGGVRLESLESLTLVGVHLDWDILFLPSLTQLELKYHAASVMPTLHQFRTILARCPHLAHLSVYGWGPILDDDVSSQRDVIHLPNVMKLSFGVLDSTYAIQFLSLLDLPSLTSLVLEDVSKAVNPVDITDTTLLLSWLTSHTDRSLVAHNSPEFLVSHFPLHQIQSLELHGIVCNTTSTLASFLRQLPSITHLGLYAIDSIILPYLETWASSAEENQDMLYNLRELNCQDMDPEMVLAVYASRLALPTTNERGSRSIRVSLEFVRNEMPAKGSHMYNRLVNAGIEVSGSVGSDTDSGTTSRRPSIF